MDRHTITGLVFGLLGVALIAGVAPAISGTSRRFNLEPPPDPVGIGFHPPTWVVAIGILHLVTTILSFAPHGIRRWAGLARIMSAISLVPLMLVLSLALSETRSTNITNLLFTSLVLATPYALGATTGLWSERSGIINIGIEGTMLAAAGIGYMTYVTIGSAHSTGWLWFSILIAVLAGGLVATLHAVLCIRFNVNQIVSGVVINLFALGLTGFLRSEVIVKSGITTGVGTSEFSLPLLSSIPVVGDQLFRGRPIYWMMYLVVLGTWVVMFRTPWGLRVRSCGENPRAAETLGVDVVRIRYQSVILGGLIAGLAGAWFSMEQQSRFEDNMTNAAGFIALAALIFGKWTPWGAFGGALLFGFSRALGSRIQFLDVEVKGFGIPSEFLQSLPFIVTLVVVAGAVGRSIPPAAAGQSFRRSG
ncbi:ABC transporter permease [Candidatus Poriferisocius sp.]|uniref:ABC transporter permease n=1 Tax=Candidatus Poriferisocius sp. TaxID=3101276 RepID=UPI003B01F730